MDASDAILLCASPNASLNGILMLLVINAASLFIFRFVLTLDGPMHVLHACIVKSVWFSGRYHTAQVDHLVNPGTLDLSDLVLIPLTTFFSAGTAHTVYAAFTLFVVGAGIWWAAKAAGVRGTWMLVWSLPLTFSFIFLLGFLTFLLSVGFALMTTAWWIQRKLATWRSLAILLLAVVGCQGVHRAGGAMAVLFLGCCEVMSFIRSGSTWRERWREVNPVLRILGLAMAGLFGAWKVIVAVTTTPRTDLPDEQDRWQELFQGRPLLLFAPELEGTMLLLLAALLLISIILALFYRMRTSGTTAAADGFGLAVLLMMAASIVFHTPNAQFLFLGARAQTVGLLVLPIGCPLCCPRT